MKSPTTPASGRIALAVAAIALIAASCGGSDPGDDSPSTIAETEASPTNETLEEGGEAETADDDDTDHTDHTDHTDDTDHTDHTDDTDHTDHTDGEEDTGSGGGQHGSADAPTRYDADVADAAQTATVEVVDGAPAGGHQRVEVDLGSVVAVVVASDAAEEVHVHGYDILRAVSDGHPAHFAFTAEIPGVFEVELEGSGRLLLQLEIS